MRRVFLCNTPYQIIVALLINEERKCENDNSDIILTDNFAHSKEIVQRLSETNYFNNVYYAKINSVLFPKNKKNKIKKITYAFFPILNIKRVFCGDIGIYDELYYNNDDIFLYSLSYYCLKKNNLLSIHRFEEGYSSYTTQYCSLNAQKIFDIYSKKNGCKKFDVLLSELLYFEPTLLVFNTNKKISKINREINNHTREVIKKTFLTCDLTEINGKWVIFEESFFQDTGYMDDYYLYENVISAIGSENVFIKLHPRTQENRFKNMGVKILEVAGAPWEALLLANPNLEVKCIALASGSIINARLMLGTKLPAFLLFKCVKKDIPAYSENFSIFVEKLLLAENVGITVVDNVDEWIRKMFEN